MLFRSRLCRQFQIHLTLSGQLVCHRCRVGDLDGVEPAGTEADRSEGAQRPQQDANPNEATAQYPWRRAAPSPNTGDKRRRRDAHTGRVDLWLGDHGYATFVGYNQRVLLHSNDMDFVPEQGDMVTAVVARRRTDGKLQGFCVKKYTGAQEQVEQALHAALIGVE